jgi:hypothetical protein
VKCEGVSTRDARRILRVVGEKRNGKKETVTKITTISE